VTALSFDDPLPFLHLSFPDSSHYTPNQDSRKLRAPPTPNAMGVITMAIQRVFFNPLSLIIMKNWAIQGIKRVGSPGSRESGEG
jgi:hypothetical protein